MVSPWRHQAKEEHSGEAHVLWEIPTLERDIAIHVEECESRDSEHDPRTEEDRE